MGCILKKEFFLKDSKNPEKMENDILFKCKVYRRIRYDTDENGKPLLDANKIYDWKVKVEQI